MKTIILSIKKFKAELMARLQSETPIWFKAIRKVAKRLLATSVALLGAEAIIHSFVLPVLIKTICIDVIIASIVAIFLSSTACKLPPELDPETSNL